MRATCSHNAILMLSAVGALLAGCNTNGVAHQNVTTERPQGQPVPVVITPTEGQVIVQNAGSAHVDEASGKLSWPAMMCTLADCPSRKSSGEPCIFPYKLDGTTIDADGAIVWPEMGGPYDPEKWAQCPVCGRRDGVRPYEAPEVVDRRAELAEELALSRVAHKLARKQGQPTPANHRTPQAIMDEIGDLPQVFLIDDGRFDSLGN